MSVAAEPLTIQVFLGPRSYDIAVVSDALSQIDQMFDAWLDAVPNRPSGPGTAVVVTDTNVAERYGGRVVQALSDAGWHCGRVDLEPGEQSKSLDTVSHIYDRLVEMKADRSTVVVAVGGGVVGDAAGFVAATYGRGVPFVQVPTTLLAQVDSSVGGKVGINHSHGKNLIGAFHQPRGVYVDTITLGTLPDREFRAGLAEVVKYGVILDREFFRYLENHVDEINDHDPDVLRRVIGRCCRLKADVVEQDEYDQTGVRAVLNYGHTFAHAFESLTGYNQLLHGEAVSIGMVYAGRLAESLNMADSSFNARQTGLLEALHVSVDSPEVAGLSGDAVMECMRLDKKTVGGRLRFVLPTQLGQVKVVDDVPEDAVRAVLPV